MRHRPSVTATIHGWLLLLPAMALLALFTHWPAVASLVGNRGEQVADGPPAGRCVTRIVTGHDAQHEGGITHRARHGAEVVDGP
jgi:hypothetical protein